MGVSITSLYVYQRCHRSFWRVERFINKQVTRPFLMRYLKRDEDARKIVACDTGLTDSVGLFSVAIQVRILKELHAQGHQVPQTPQQHPNDVLAAIATIRSAQVKHDAELDSADLYAAMRAALRMGSDFAMLDILQVCNCVFYIISVLTRRIGRQKRNG